MRKGMGPVVQEDPFGCAVACTAFILRTSYQDALKLFKDGELRVKTKANFYCREIVQILNNRGLSYEYRYIKGKVKQQLKDPEAIVFIKRSKRYPFGHFLCRTKEGWMDPWINIPSIPRAAGYREQLPDKASYLIFQSVKIQT